MSDKDRLQQLLLAIHPLIWISTYEESDALELVNATALEVGASLWRWSVNTGVCDGLLKDAKPIEKTDHPAAALFWLSQQTKPCVAVMLDLAAHLKDERTLRLLRDTVEKFEQVGARLILVDGAEQLPPVVRAYATRFELSLPDSPELEEILRLFLRRLADKKRIQVELSRQELDQVIQNMRGLNRRQVCQIVADSVADDRRFDINDLNRVISGKRRALQGEGMLEFIEAPVSLDEIGGLRKLKEWLHQRQNAQTKKAEEFGLQSPRGILMLGVQGAGKSLAAKAVATAWRWPLLRMDVGSMYDRYIGESEHRLRESLHQAQRMAPVILWIDEIEKGFASAASQSTDGGVSRRMFGEMLTWMQEHKEPVFIIATANDIEALPPELLRKGRFDEIFFVDLPVLEARYQIFQIHIRKRKRKAEEFDLAKLAEAADGFSGAEIEQAIVSALHTAFAAGKELSTEGILSELKNSPPLSVTMAERVAALRAWSVGRCVPAD